MSDAAMVRPDLSEAPLRLGSCDKTPDGAAAPTPRESLLVLLTGMLEPVVLDGLPAEFRDWLSECQADWERALLECPDRRWLTWLSGALMRRGHLKHEVLVLYACARRPAWTTRLRHALSRPSCALASARSTASRSTRRPLR